MPQHSKPRKGGEDQTRFAPGTIVIWYDGLEAHRGRVMTNLAGVNGRPGTVVIKAANGDRKTVSVTKVVAAGEGASS